MASLRGDRTGSVANPHETFVITQNRDRDAEDAAV